MTVTIPNPIKMPTPTLWFPPDFPPPAAGKQRIIICPTVAEPRIWQFDIFAGFIDIGPGPDEPDGDGESYCWADPAGKLPGVGVNLKWHLHPLDMNTSACQWSGFALPANVTAVTKIYTLIVARFLEPANWVVCFGTVQWSIGFTGGNMSGAGVGPIKGFWDDVTPGVPSTFDYADLKAYSYINGTLSDGTGDRLGVIEILAVLLVVDGELTGGPKVLPYLKIPPGQGQTINELDGHSSVGELQCEANDPGRELELLAARSDAVGSRAIFRMGFPGMDHLGDFLVLHTDQLVDVGRSEDGWMEYRAQDVQRSMVEEIFTEGGPNPYTFGQDPPPEPPLWQGFASNGHPISDANPRYIYGNPIDILLVALQNELGIGQRPGAESSAWKIYDPMQIPSQIEGWTPVPPGSPHFQPIQTMPASLIYPNRYLDIDGILKFRNYDFSGDRMEFKLTRAVTGKSWIDDQILKPLGLFWIVRSDGRLSLKSMKSPQALDPSVANWTKDNIIGIPTLERLPITNVLTIRFDADDMNRETAAREYDSEKPFIEQESIDLYQQESKSSVEATGLRISYGGMLRGQILSNRVFGRHAGISGDGKNSPTPQYSFATFLKEGMVEIGDFVRLTHSLLVDLKTGLRGVTDVLCEVIDKQPDYAAGQFNWKVWDTRFMNLSTPYYILKRGAIVLAGYKIAPVTMPVWTSASIFQKATYMFACDVTTREYSDSTPGHPIAGGSVVFQTGDYNSALPDQQAKYMFISNSLNGYYSLPATVLAVESTHDGYLASNTVDGNPSSIWSSDNGETSWISYDLRSQRTFDQIAIRTRRGSNGGSPKTFDVYVTDDPTDFGSAIASLNGSGNTTAAQTIYDLGATYSKRFVKLVINTTWGATNVVFSEFNIALAGVVDPTIPGHTIF